MIELGPRQGALLESWASTIDTSTDGDYYDFTSPTRTDKLHEKVNQFIESPTEDGFRAIWSPDIIRNAQYGGENSVLNNWNEPLEELATFVQTIRDAESYDPAWERRIPGFLRGAIWELYGRFDPENRPIINKTVQDALPSFGLPTPKTHAEGAEQLQHFIDLYEQRVGHVTAQTDHEVVLNDEIEQFLYVVITADEAGLRSSLGMDHSHQNAFAGWDAMRSHGDEIELSGLTSILDAFTTGSNSDAYETDSPLEHWGANHWETWKDDYCAYLTDEVFPTYDPTDLDPAEIEPFLDQLTVARPISDVVPIYLLGGRWQPWDSFQKISQASPEEAADVLSSLFDEDSGAITDRLGKFNDFYIEASDSGSERMSLATMLLMLVHPDQYAMYRHNMFKDFFSAFSTYDLSNGFNPSEYVLMNEALRSVQQNLDTYVDDDVRMLDVHSLLWVYHREGPP